MQRYGEVQGWEEEGPEGRRGKRRARCQKSGIARKKEVVEIVQQETTKTAEAKE